MILILVSESCLILNSVPLQQGFKSYLLGRKTGELYYSGGRKFSNVATLPLSGQVLSVDALNSLWSERFDDCFSK